MDTPVALLTGEVSVTAAGGVTHGADSVVKLRVVLVVLPFPSFATIRQ
jgi:hypothetical protein